MNEVITKEKYQQLLDTHDWNYHFSDDHKVWKKGAENEQELLDLAKNDIELTHLWQQKWSKMIKLK